MHLLPPLVAAAWLAGLVAQSPSSTSVSAAPSGRLASPNVAAEQGVVTDTAVDGTLWAAGPTWKASFAADGTTFVPCFGPAAPRNFPAAMPRAVVSVAGQLLAGEPVPPTFAFAAVVTTAAAAISALLVRRRLDELDLVAVLKARE